LEKVGLLGKCAMALHVTQRTLNVTAIPEDKKALLRDFFIPPPLAEIPPGELLLAE
jgi:hypothetical protein